MPPHPLTHALDTHACATFGTYVHTPGWNESPVIVTDSYFTFADTAHALDPAGTFNTHMCAFKTYERAFN